MTELFFNHSGYSYKGVYQEIGKLHGLSNQERLWTILGAALYELSEAKYKDIIVYHDTDLVDLWGAKTGFPSDKCLKIHNLIQKMTLNNNMRVRLEKVDSLSLQAKLGALKLK